MIGDKRKFLSLEKRKDGGFVAFRDNKKKTLIKEVVKIGKPNSSQIENVYYVKWVKHHHLSISEIYDNGYEVKFEPNVCLIKEASIGKILFLGVKERNLYRICLKSLPSQSCLASFESDKWFGIKE